MGLKEQAIRMASSAAGVALATTGLSSCNDNGAVDPPPPPFQCSEVNMGQSLSATATITSDTVDVIIRNTRPEISWFVNNIRDVVGAELVDATLPLPGSGPQTLALALKLDTPTTTEVHFTLMSTFFGFGDQCPYPRVYTLTIGGGTVLISAVDPDELPLASRQQPQITLAHQEAGMVRLQGRVPHPGPFVLSWQVSAGQLDGNGESEVTWRLPREPGVYAAELVADFGAEGVGFDVLMVEVLPDHI